MKEPIEMPPQFSYSGSEWSSEYFLQHRKDIDTMIEHLKLFAPGPTDKMVALDVGAGEGMHAGFMSRVFGEVYAADLIRYSERREGSLCKYIQNQFGLHDINLDMEKVHFVYSNAHNLIFKDNFFDIVVSINCFEHIENPELALSEMVRCTKPGGYTYIEFDPIWTADTGSHFSYLVSEPWAHLVYSRQEFVRRMEVAGAKDWELHDFQHAMNEKRPGYFLDLFLNQPGVEVVHQTTIEQWSGVVDESHLVHPFFSECQLKGFSREELLLRGMRILFRKTV